MLTLDKIYQASHVLRSVIRKTDLIQAPKLCPDCNLFLKTENLQVTGSFKVRGAYYMMSQLTEEEKARGVIACSAGNHAQGVALAAAKNHMKALICLPDGAPISKVEATKSYGAEVCMVKGVYDDAYNKAVELQKEHNYTFVHPFDNENVIAGQGTIGLEILDQMADVDAVIVPIGGGGLISGVAACAKQINPRIQIIGVQAEGAPAIANSFRTGERTPSDTVHTIADGIAVKTPGEKTFEYIKQYVDRVVTVSDDEIASAVLLLLERCKQVVETSGAAPLAAVLNNKVDVKGKKVVCVLSGGNIDVSFIHKIVEKGLITRCRQLKFSVLMPDAPGALEHFSHIVAQQNANIILFQHDRVQTDLEIGEAIIHVVCEVGGVDHAKRLIDTLTDDGYKVFTSQI